MKLKGTVTVNASQEEVWRIFMDPTQFCRVVPGCEKARRIDDTHYEAILAVKMPFLTIRSKAKGTGSFRNRVTIDLVPINNKTKIQYTMDITLVGRLASLGEGFARLIARRFSKEFVDNVSKLFNNPGRR